MDKTMNWIYLWKRLTTEKCSDGIFSLLPLFLRDSDAVGLLVTLGLTWCPPVPGHISYQSYSVPPGSNHRQDLCMPCWFLCSSFQVNTGGLVFLRSRYSSLLQHSAECTIQDCQHKYSKHPCLKYMTSPHSTCNKRGSFLSAHLEQSGKANSVWEHLYHRDKVVKIRATFHRPGSQAVTCPSPLTDSTY